MGALIMGIAFARDVSTWLLDTRISSGSWVARRVAVAEFL